MTDLSRRKLAEVNLLEFVEIERKARYFLADSEARQHLRRHRHWDGLPQSRVTVERSVGNEKAHADSRQHAWVDPAHRQDIANLPVCRLREEGPAKREVGWRNQRIVF